MENFKSSNDILDNDEKIRQRIIDDGYLYLQNFFPKKKIIEIANGILERILTLDPNLILPEQFNPITNEFLSAKKLTWNYSELYQLYKLLN